MRDVGCNQRFVAWGVPIFLAWFAIFDPVPNWFCGEQMLKWMRSLNFVHSCQPARLTDQLWESWKRKPGERSVARCLLFDAAFHESIIEWKLVFQAKAGGGSSFVRTLGSDGLESHAGSTRANTSTILFTPGHCAKHLADKWYKWCFFFVQCWRIPAVIWHFHFTCIRYIHKYIYICIIIYLCVWSKTSIHATPLATKKLKVRAGVARCESFSRSETFTWFSKTGAFMA